MDIKMGIKGHQRHMQTLLGSRKVTPNLIPPHHEPFITMPAHEAYVDMFALLASHVNGLRQTMVQTLRRHCGGCQPCHGPNFISKNEHLVDGISQF